MFAYYFGFRLTHDQANPIQKDPSIVSCLILKRKKNPPNMPNVYSTNTPPHTRMLMCIIHTCVLHNTPAPPPPSPLKRFCGCARFDVLCAVAHSTRTECVVLLPGRVHYARLHDVFWCIYGASSHASATNTK